MVASRKGRAKLHHRRGLSTIVGGAIFLVLFTGAFSTFFLAMDFQRDTINTQRAISDSIMEKTKEKFSISVSTGDVPTSIPNNKLAIQVKNQGINPVEIDNIWIINNSGTHPAEKYLIDYKDSVIPPGYGVDILDSSTLFMYSDDYDIKVVSTLGTIEKADLIVGSANNLRATLIAIPPDVKVGQNVTLTLHVENIGNTRLLNVAPVNDSGKLHPNINPEFTTPHPAPPQSVDLDPGEGFFFMWKYETTGAASTIVKFNANATATEEITGFSIYSNTAYEKIELKEPDVTETIVLNQDLLSRPEIFMIIPGPFGDTDNLGVWGVNVVNPTAQAMNVTKITISALNPRDDSFDQFFFDGNCNTVDIPVTAYGAWDCNTHNQMTWEPPSGSSPAQIQPFSVREFLVFAQPGILLSTADLHTALIQAHVFTSSGEFGKGNYGSSMKAGGEGMVNVYLTDVYPGTLSGDDILSTITGIPGGTHVAFNATLAEFEFLQGHKIEDEDPPGKATLIVNIPKGWTDVVVTDSPGFDYVKTNTFADGSSQLVGIVSNELLFGTESMKFYARAPAVTTTQMYVMYMLANGVTDSGWTIGPLGEIILQVVP